MNKFWIAVNAGLIVVSAYLGWLFYDSTKEFEAENDLSNLQAIEDPKIRVSDEDVPLPIQPDPPQINAQEFAIIPDQNVFSETRTMAEETEEVAKPEAPSMQTKPVLVGVTLSDREQLAIVRDPSARGARAQIMRIGDTFQGYTITEIALSRMVLESGGRREIIPLYDSAKHPGKGGKTPILATRVINFGSSSGGARGAQQRRVITNPVPARSNQPTAAARSDNRVISTRSDTGRQTPTSRTSAGSSAQPSQKTTGNQSQQPATWNETVDAKGNRVIRTPFGNIVRPAPKTKPPDKPKI